MMMVTPETVRKVCWEVGSLFPNIQIQHDCLTLHTTAPWCGFVQWTVSDTTINTLRQKLGDGQNGATIVVRIYDVTDIMFDGANAHSFFDIVVHHPLGNYYFKTPRIERSYLACAGFRLVNGSFCEMIRSSAVFFDRDRQSGRTSAAGRYISHNYTRDFHVDPMFPLDRFDSLTQAIKKSNYLVPHILHVISSSLHVSQINFINNLTENEGHFGVHSTIFSTEDNPDRINHANNNTEVTIVHGHCLTTGRHCLVINKQYGFPYILSISSDDCQKLNATIKTDESMAVSIKTASKIIVETQTDYDILVNKCEISPSVISIFPGSIPHIPEAATTQQPIGVRQKYGFPENSPLFYFCSEMSHAAGADLLMSALPKVCREYNDCFFAFAGDGPLKNELEHQVHSIGLGHRCRFFGHIASNVFDDLMSVCTFFVVPARTWQDESAIKKALSLGKPVLATHQSHVRCINHGQNGLLAYDNQGSIEWGLKELLHLFASIGQTNSMVLPHQKSPSDTAAQSLIVLYQQLCAESSKATNG